MARKTLKRWLPDPAEFKKRPGLKFLGSVLHDPNLFHINRHSVSGAFFLGVFIAFLPILGQMPAAAILALICRVNLPIAVALVWISNPVTIPPIFYGCYELGRWLLNTPPLTFSVELSTHWFTHEFIKLWEPLLVGSLMAGVFFGGLSYIAMQLFWRWQVNKHWQQRKARRLKAAADKAKEK